MQIYFVGAHSTGKTTCARYVSNKYKLPLLTEVARTVLAEMELTLDSVRTAPETADEFQLEVNKRQIAQELEAEGRGGFVSDRALDHLAYAAQYSQVTHMIAANGLQQYVERLKRPSTLVFYVRPHAELIRSDGVRNDLDWGAVCHVDGAVRMLLELYHIRYFPISDKNMIDRVRLIDGILQLAGQIAVESAPLWATSANVKVSWDMRGPPF